MDSTSCESAMMATRQGILRAIGNTPLIPLSLSSEQSFGLYAKLEFLNPSGSMKDRAALYMIEQAEQRQEIGPDTTLIEASSGNQGIAVAMIGAVKRYPVIITVPRRTSQEKIAALRAYGATVHIADEEGRQGYRELAHALHRERPNSYLLNQYYNPENSAAHFYSTGPELWHATQGAITHILIPMGTCGAIVGIGRYLKAQNPSIQILGIDAATSLLSSQGHPSPYQVEGLGVDQLDGLFNPTLIDAVYGVTDEEIFATTRRMATEQGLLLGLSSGAVMKVLFDLWSTFPPSACVVVLFADSGRAYLKKLFS